MSDQQQGDRSASGAGEDVDPALGSEGTPDVLSGGAAGAGDGAGRGGSPADETSPGSDGDGVESGYTPPDELETDPAPGEPTD